MPHLTQAKALARSLQTALEAAHITLSYGRALETIATAHGCAEWNIYAAKPCPLLPDAQAEQAIRDKLSSYGVDVTLMAVRKAGVITGFIAFPPSIGKTTLLRYAAEKTKTGAPAVILDSSGEIAGEGTERHSVVKPRPLLTPLDMSPLWRHSAEDIRRWTGVYLHLEAEVEFSDWARGDVGPATYADDEEEAEAKAEQWQAIEGLAEDIHSFLPDLDRLTGLKAWVDAQNGPVNPEELLRWIFSHNREGWNLTLACYSGIKKGPSPEVTSLTREGWTGLMWAIGKNRKEAEDAAYRNLAKGYGLRRILRRDNPQAS